LLFEAKIAVKHIQVDGFFVSAEELPPYRLPFEAKSAVKHIQAGSFLVPSRRNAAVSLAFFQKICYTIIETYKT
jgi:hypothetical protein